VNARSIFSIERSRFAEKKLAAVARNFPQRRSTRAPENSGENYFPGRQAGILRLPKNQRLE
jgi:hypothetical protein